MPKYNQLQQLLHVSAKYVPKTNRPTKLDICHTCQIFVGHIWQIYTHICAKYDVTPIHHVTRNNIHIFDISLNKYGCPTANIAQTAKMLYGHIDPTLLHVFAKIQTTAKTSSHVIAKYKYAHQTGGHTC